METADLTRIMLVALCCACSATTDSPDAGTPVETCLTYGAPDAAATLDTRITESSGLAASRLHPGTWWTHDDSGHEPQLFAIGDDGALRATLTVRGVPGIDWEDLAAGPCPDGVGTCLVVGDIGDNTRSHPSVQLVVVREPDALGDATVDPVVTLAVTYDRGPRDCETLLVDPTTGDVWLVEKGGRGAFRVPAAALRAGGSAVATHVVDVTFVEGSDGFLTGGDIRTDGKRVVLRTYLKVQEHRGATVAEALAAEPIDVTGTDRVIEAQGEAVAYGPDGSIRTTSEGVGTTIFERRCE